MRKGGSGGAGDGSAAGRATEQQRCGRRSRRRRRRRRDDGRAKMTRGQRWEDVFLQALFGSGVLTCFIVYQWNARALLRACNFFSLYRLSYALNIFLTNLFVCMSFFVLKV
jgi:hypothetical protein